MAGRIPKHFIDDLITRTDIVEVINARVPLKKAGREYKACCPFHEEKTPSFTVSPDKQFYHCFGCGAHGTAIGFLMDFEHLDFVESVESLAGSLGIEVPREASPTPQKREPDLYETTERAANFYREQLKGNDDAISYLKNRGLTGKIAAEFSIGFALESWDALSEKLGKTPEDSKRLLATGLASRRSDGSLYDRFRNRIIFPIRDARGRVIGFGGRVIGDDEPKYLNSPETPLFHKGRELYGLFEARKNLRDIERLIVVEGYMDVVGLANKGIRNVVATLGTATTTEHIRRLFRVTEEIVFCFDGDRAGRAAAWRALETALPEMREGRDVRFLFVPEGQDPDSLVREQGAAAFEARLPGAMPLSDFLLNHLEEEIDLSSLEGRARLAERAKPLLRKIPTGVYQQLLTERLANKVKMATQTLDALLDDQTPNARPARLQKKPPISIGRGNLIRQAIALLLRRPALAIRVDDPGFLAESGRPGTALLAELIDELRDEPDLTTAQLVERWRDRDESRHLERLIETQMAENTPELSPEALENEFDDLMQRLWARLSPARETELLDKLSREGLSEEELEELKTLHAQRNTA